MKPVDRREKMKAVTFKNQAAQGDLLIRRIENIPSNAKPVQAEQDSYIVAHSETGHDHVIEATPNVMLFTTDSPLVSYLQVIEATDTMEALIEHLRPFDTHKTIAVPPGNYEIRRQREYSPKGWRMVAD